MLAFKNDPAIKSKFLSRVKMHREADELVQGYGYWKDGKGCAVGCTLHKNDNCHKAYERQLGIPEQIAQLEDEIFEGLPVKLARKWPERFLRAIKPGADLSRVWHKFAVWLLRDSELLAVTDVNREAIAAVVQLHVRGATGDAPSREEWSAARSSAESSAASSAASAAEKSAAWSAAASAAASAAEKSAAYENMADKLIRLLKSA